MAPPSINSLPSVTLARDVSASKPNSPSETRISSSVPTPEASPSLPNAKGSSNPLTEKDVQQINDRLKQSQSDLSFQYDVDPQSGSLRSFQLINQNTKEVVLQVPSPQMLAIRDHLDQIIKEQSQHSDKSLTGVFVNLKT